MLGQQSVQLKVETGFSFNFPSVLGLINLYGRARAGAQQKRGAKGSACAELSVRASRGAIPSGLQTRSAVNRTHWEARARAPPIGGVSESRAHSFECSESHTPALPCWKINRWTAIL